MGNGFWIFIAIVVIQAVVGGIAKSAEKRKKREAQQALASRRSSVNVSTPAASSGADDRRDGDDVADVPQVARRLGEMLRATIEAGTGASVDVSASLGRRTPPQAPDRASLQRPSALSSPSSSQPSSAVPSSTRSRGGDPAASDQAIRTARQRRVEALRQRQGRSAG